MLLLPHPTLPFSSRSVKDLLCQSCCLRALVTFSIHLKARLKNSREKVCILHFFFFLESLQRIFCKPKCVFYYGLHQQTDLGDFCLCVFLLLILCVCVRARVCLSWPLFPLEKGDSKTHLKIYTHSVRSPVHSSEDAPAVLGKMPRNIRSCVNHNSPLPCCV